MQGLLSSKQVREREEGAEPASLQLCWLAAAQTYYIEAGLAVFASISQLRPESKGQP